MKPKSSEREGDRNAEKRPFLRETSYANAQGIQAIQHHELQGPIGSLNKNEMQEIRAELAKMFEIESPDAIS